MDILVEIERTTQGYWGHATNVPGIIVGNGRSKEECLKDVENALNFAIQTSKELGRDTYTYLEEGFTVKES